MKKTPKKILKVLGKGKKIDENIHHKMKALKRKQEVLKMLNDIENHNEIEQQVWMSEVSGTHERIRGYIPKKKKDHSKTIFWIVMGIIGLPFVWMGIISLIDIL